MKIANDKEREMLLNEKHRIEGERSELKMREDQLMNTMKSIQTLRTRLQQLHEKMSKGMKNNMDTLQQKNDEVLKLSTVLEQKLAELDKQKENVACYTEQLEKEKEGLRSVLSDMVIQRENTENQWKQKFEMEKQDLDKLKAELKQDRENLDRLNEMMKKEKVDVEMMRLDLQKQTDLLEQVKQDVQEEKEKMEITKTEFQKKKENLHSLFDEINKERSNIKDLSLQVETERDKLQNVMNSVALKQEEQERKEDDIRRQTQELETSENNALAEREELELLRKDLRGEKEEVEAAMKRISGEREQLSQMKMSFDIDRQALDNEKDEMEGKLSELKMREDELMNKILSIQILRDKLQELNEKTCRHIKKQTDKLDQNNKDVQRLHLALEEMLENFEQERDQMSLYSERIQRQKADLKGIPSNMLMQREDIENQWKQTFEMEKQDFDKLKAELKQDRENLDRLNEMMKKEKVDVEMMRLDLQKQTDLLEQVKQDIQEQKEKISSYYDPIQRKKTHVLATKFDKILQSDIVSNEWLQQQDVKKDVPQSNFRIMIEGSEQHLKLDEIKHYFGREGNRLKTETEGLMMVVEGEEVENKQTPRLAPLSDYAVQRDDSTGVSVSKRDSLQTIWRETKKERTEIDQMKRRGHEIRNNLEKRLKVINQFVKRTWLQNEKDPLEKTKLEEGLRTDTTSKTELEIDRKALNEKHTELQQLKVQILSEIEKLHIKEVSRKLTTSDKANQTFRENVTIVDATVQVTEHTSTEMYKEVKVEEPEAAPETTSGLLCQLWHSCSRCCRPCCACCKQVLSVDK
ncbi:hypothetical protein L3Q82_006346 [Scortum barcoo]|uniref:Uncharacterized protein n=1 Tax=Scortum barcoo TaxID=214431 RepID=A0ACB8WYG9_9TELE|nr:hypothetical protein L3Q82_006346 [Scortum barcoo]